VATSSLPARPPLLAVALLSASALSYEILLIRLFSIIQWHHFAYMIISLALLGYGASGAFLAFHQSRLLAHYPLALLANLALFACSALPCFLLAQQISFNPEQMLWEGNEMLRLIAIYLLLSLPFFFAANAIALTLARYPAVIARVYAVDLLGAGLGSLAVIILLTLLPPLPALSALSVAALACLPLAATALHMQHRARLLAATALLAAAALWLGNTTELRFSTYKDVSQALRVTGAQLVHERHSPLAVLQVIDNARVPTRVAPGMSLNALQGPPGQLGLFSDGNSMGAITRNSDDPGSLDFLDQLTSALPYHLQDMQRVLVVGAAGGMDVLQAKHLGAGSIQAIELDPQVIDLLNNDFGTFAGNLYRQPNVQLHIGEGRGFIEQHDNRYELIQLTLQASGGLYALSENYLYTVEALQAYLAHLDTDGYLAINQWTHLPARATLKMFATAIEALRRTAVEEPEKHLLMIRGWQTSTLLVAASPVTEPDIEALKNFCRLRSFDLVWYPGMSEHEANRFNILAQASYHNAARALLGPESTDFIRNYKFDLRPTTDDRPYFNNFFKWSTLTEILALREQGGLPLLEAGYLVLVATLVQALAASILIILLPLLFLRRPAQHARQQPISRLRVVLYFTTIGLAFLFVEIAFIQKFMQFLHHPLYTTSVVLAAFLVFAGLGSNQAQRLVARTHLRRAAILAVTGILLSGVLGLLWLDELFTWFAYWSTAARIALSVMFIAPLAFFMGMPFPLALTSLGRTGTALIPLAWGVNGCASVISAVLATLLAVHFGFNVVVMLALGLYVFSALTFPDTHSDQGDLYRKLSADMR
jgi:spermidine synthase